jgi:hypothetical protein
MSDVSGRLVKVQLPASTVSRMDGFINASESYAGRAELITDAVEAFLEEMGAPAAAHAKAAKPSWSGPAAAPEATIDLTDPAEAPGLPIAIARSLARISAIPDDGPTVQPSGGPRPGAVSFGLRNRDFPTIWAGMVLGREAADHGGVDFEGWAVSTAHLAGELGRALSGDAETDPSGFPTSAKRTQGEARFRTHFLGVTPGQGALFDLGLAGVAQDGRVAVTEAGRDLLGRLAGLSCRVTPPSEDHRRTWFAHLATWMPADLQFYVEIVEAISDGHDHRDELLKAMAVRHGDWKEGVVSTNTAGAVGRLREWGVLARRQQEGRYLVADTAPMTDAVKTQEVA